MNSPLFFKTFDKKAAVSRVAYKASSPVVAEPIEPGKVYEAVAAPNRLEIRFDIIDKNDCQLVQNIEEAEDVILGLANVIEHDISPASDQTPEYFAGILSQALRYGSIIANRTRISPGNVILLGRDLYEMIDSAYKALGTVGIQASEPEMVGRWEKKGQAVGGAVVYVGDAIPANEGFVAYVGRNTSIDGAGGLLEDEGELYLHVLANTESALGNAEDYVQRFRVNLV